MAYINYADIARRVGADEKISVVSELLAQCNAVFDDMIWDESSHLLGHQGTVRTSLPQGTWRQPNAGVPFTRSTTDQVFDTWGELAAYSRVDKSLADIGGNAKKLRADEALAHIEGLSQQMATAVFYGNEAASATQFTGLSQRFATLNTANAQNAVNVLSGGGSGNSNASMWLCCWGPRTGFGFFPKETKAGLDVQDLGDIRPGFDANNREYQAYTTYFQWRAGLHISNWQYFVRIANLDVTTTAGGLASTTPPDLFVLMSKAVRRLPASARRLSGITTIGSNARTKTGPLSISAAWYANRTVLQYLDIQAIRNARVLLGPREYAGQPVEDFRGAPIRCVDALTVSEATVS